MKMSTYADKNLNKDEEIVFRAETNVLALLGSIIWCVLVLIGVCIATYYLANLSVPETGIEEVDVVGSAANDTLADIAVYLILAAWVLWLLIGVLPLVIKLIKLLTMCLVITNKRVIGKVGVIGIKTLDYPIEKVDNVTMKAGVFGNLCHFHMVTILGGGGTDAGINFIGIKNAPQFKNAITAAVEQHAEEARKAQAEEIARAMGK